MLILTGVTGNLSSSILRHLLSAPISFPLDQIVATSAHPDSQKAKDLLKLYPGLQLRRADYLAPETLNEAFAGGDKLLLISYPGIDDQRTVAHKNVIDAAKRCGIQHIYYTSLAFGNPTVTHVMLAHVGTEKLLAESGVSFTIIREGIYHESFPLYLGFWTPGARDCIVAGDGPVSFASRDELAEATAKIVADASDQWKNKVVKLTGPEAITLKDAVKMITEITGEQIHFKVVSINEYSETFKDRGDFVAKWALSHTGIAQGEAGEVTPTLEALLGRKSTRFRKYLEYMLADVEKAKARTETETTTYAL
ncbi:NmrA-like family protein [Gaertneriomyces semiglobifer]|nr:NmrA-like family protein [Gaertneriomyces semiglobifer]